MVCTVYIPESNIIIVIDSNLKKKHTKKCIGLCAFRGHRCWLFPVLFHCHFNILFFLLSSSWHPPLCRTPLLWEEQGESDLLFVFWHHRSRTFFIYIYIFFLHSLELCRLESCCWMNVPWARPIYGSGLSHEHWQLWSLSFGGHQLLPLGVTSPDDQALYESLGCYLRPYQRPIAQGWYDMQSQFTVSDKMAFIVRLNKVIPFR